MSSIFYIFGLLLCVLAAQAENLTKEQQRILLDFQEAHLILEQAKAREAEVEIEHEQMIGLKERGVVTGQELRMARERFERARQERQRADLNLQRAFLNSLADATHLTVVNGQKYGVEGDKVRVRLTLRNDSDLNLAQMVDQRPPTLRHQRPRPRRRVAVAGEQHLRHHPRRPTSWSASPTKSTSRCWLSARKSKSRSACSVPRSRTSPCNSNTSTARTSTSFT